MSDKNNPQNTQGVATNPTNQNPVSSPFDQPGTINASSPQPAERPPLTKDTPTFASPSPTPLQQPGPVITTEDPKGGDKGKNKRVVATILGIILLLAAVGAGVFLVGQQQEIREQAKAKGCIDYSFFYTGGLSDIGSFCEGNNVTRSDKPNLVANSLHISCSDTINPDGTAEKSDLAGHLVASFFITKYDEDRNVKKTCGEQTTPTPIPTPTDGPTPTANPSPTLSPTPTLTPTPPAIGAACLDVKAYDTGWNQLSSGDLASLKPGDIIRFAVGGTTTSGGFDKARFTINGTLRTEVTAQKPGSDEFYDEYTVPAGITNFTVNAEIHHTSLDWF